MLYTQTVAPATLGLLKRLQSEPALGISCLTGRMALALHLGHRACRVAELLRNYPLKPILSIVPSFFTFAFRSEY